MAPAHNNATHRLFRILEENHQSRPIGIYSVCSANRFVLEAGMIQAKRDDSLLLIESTSNQVNQFGGYTGQTPLQFATSVRELARTLEFPSENVVFGGDHLGPQAWRKEGAESAMQKARGLVRDCVLAGYTKIHLDASMHLVGDPGDSNRPLSDEIVCERAADLCLVAEQAHQAMKDGSPAPLYVIGTEVPIPGGEQLGTLVPEMTTVESVEQTLRLARRAFYSRGLQAAWERVVAIVVQPGVEFGDSSVFAYDHKKALALGHFIERSWHGVYEAHSTDYQTAAALRQMVKDHFAILKVGPWLTFAFREAVFALAAIEEESLGELSGAQTSKIRKELELAMLRDSSHWKGYYHGDESKLLLSRKYSYSDRSRYYWPQAPVASSLDRLIDNLRAHPVPLGLLSQYLPVQADRIHEGAIENDPHTLIRDKVLEVLSKYSFACGMQVAQ
jgi:D-tagatose-1,6-bisphosphate aldolase subunit GatZ/KbaZ